MKKILVLRPPLPSTAINQVLCPYDIGVLKGAHFLHQHLYTEIESPKPNSTDSHSSHKTPCRDQWILGRPEEAHGTDNGCSLPADRPQPGANGANFVAC